MAVKYDKSGFGRLKNNGRDDRIWTCDPLHPMQVHYQAVLHPVNRIIPYSSDIEGIKKQPFKASISTVW